MHAILQGIKEGLPVDRRMRGSFCQIEKVLDKATIAESLSNEREAVSLPSSIQHCSKLGTD